MPSKLYFIAALAALLLAALFTGSQSHITGFITGVQTHITGLQSHIACRWSAPSPCTLLDTYLYMLKEYAHPSRIRPQHSDDFWWGIMGRVESSIVLDCPSCLIGPIADRSKILTDAHRHFLADNLKRQNAENMKDSRKS